MTMRAFMSIIKKGERSKVKREDTLCRCTRSRGTLVVHCLGCRGGQDLSDPACLRRVLLALASEPSATGEIVLSSHWEVRYDHACTTALGSLAEVIRFLRATSEGERFEDCPGCPAHPRTVMDRVATTIPLASPELRDGYTLVPGPHGSACDQCTRTTAANLQHARTLLAAAHGLVNRSAFRVVSGDDR